MDNLVQNSQGSTSLNVHGEKNEFVNHLVDDSYAARGFGLIAATVGRQSEFYLYSKYGYNFENIVIELKGRNFEISRATILNQNLVHPVEPKSISIDYAYDDDRVKVTYIPFAEGVHTLTLLRNGVHICRSPYYISVEKSPTNSRSRIRLGTKKYKIVTKFGKGKCAPIEIKNSEMPVIESCKSSTEFDVHPLAEDNYKGTDVMSIVTKFESKSASKELPKRLSSITERSPEKDQADNDFIDSKEQLEIEHFPENNNTDDQNTKKKCKMDLKLENINLKYSNNLNTLCESIADGENFSSTKPDSIHDETIKITSNVPQNVSPIPQKHTQNKCLHNENWYKTEMFDQTSQINKPSQGHGDLEIIVTTHQSKINVTDDKIHLINEICKDEKIAVVKENIKELNKDSSIHVDQPLPDLTQYNINTPLAWIIKNITNSICEKCSKQVFKILSELPRDINIKQNTNLKEFCSSFETLLAQPIKININIDDEFENTSCATTDPFNSTHLKIDDSKNLKVDNMDVQSLKKIKSSHNNTKTLFNDTSNITNTELTNEQQKCDIGINKILEQNITDNISTDIAECSIDIAGHQENELPLKKVVLQKLVNKKIEPINYDVLYSNYIYNTENKSGSHESKLQTNLIHVIDLIKSNHCDEKLNNKYLYYDVNEGRDLVLETNDLLLVSCVEDINETQDSDKTILLKDAHIQQTNSKFHNCITNNTLSPSSSSLLTTNKKLEDIECTKLEHEHQTFNVCEINNSYLNKKLTIEQSIEPVLNSFKNQMVERILQLCVNENLSNTNFNQLLQNYKTNKNRKQHKIQLIDPANKEKFLNTENRVIENKKTIMKQEKNYIDKNRIPDIILDKNKTNNDLQFEYIKNSFDECKNSDEYNTEIVAKKLCIVANTKMHNLHDDHVDEIYDTNFDQKNEKDTFAQEIQLVTSTLNDPKVILEDESKSIKLGKFNPGKILIDTETIPIKLSDILNSQNAFVQEVISNAKTITTDDLSFEQTGTSLPITENNKTIDLNIINTTKIETTFCAQTSNKPESDVIKISTTIETEPLSNNQNIDDSNTSTLELSTALENTFSNFSMNAEATKLSSSKMETTYDKILNEIKADEIEKFNTVDTEIVSEETTKTVILKNETIKDVNTIETKTIKVATTMSKEPEPIEKVKIPNVSELKMSTKTPVSENTVSVEHVEYENNIELKALSEINKIDCANLITVDEETEFKLPSSNVTAIIVVNKTNSKEITPKVDTLVSNSTAIVTIKIETQSDSYLPNTTLTIKVQEPNTVIIENLSNIKITNITNNYKETLKREIEIDNVEETPSVNYNATLLSKTINKNDLNNIKTTLQAIDATITSEVQKSNETEIIKINKDQTSEIDALAEKSVPVIESKKEIETTSDIFVSLKTPSSMVETLKEINADTETSNIDNSIVTFIEQSNKVETITTPKIEKFNNIGTIICEEKQILSESCITNIFSNTQSKEEVIENISIISEANNTLSVCPDKLENANTSIKIYPNMLSSVNRDTSTMCILTPKSNKYEIETTSKTQIPNDILYDSIDTPIELECESVVLDSPINNIQSIFIDENKLEKISDTFVLNENPTIQLNKLNKEELKTTPITPVPSNTLIETIEMQNKILKFKTVDDTLISNNTWVKSEEKTEIKIVPEAKVSNEILNIQDTSELLKNMPVEDTNVSKELKKPTLAILWPNDDTGESNKEFLKNEEIRGSLENLKLKNSVVETVETPNESEIENLSKTLISINKANKLKSNFNEPQNKQIEATSETSLSNCNQIIFLEEKIIPITFIENENVTTLLSNSNEIESKNILKILEPNNMPTEPTKTPNELGNITLSVTPVLEDVDVNSIKESIKIEFEIQQERAESNASTEPIKAIKKLNVIGIEKPLKISASNNTIAIMPKEKEEVLLEKLDHFENNPSENQVSQNISEILAEESEKTNNNTKIESPISNDTFSEAKNLVEKKLSSTPETLVLNKTQITLDENPNDIGLSIQSKTTSKYTLSELKNKQKVENTLLQTPVLEKTSSVLTENFKTLDTEVKNLASYISSFETINDQNKFKITPETLESKDTSIVLKRELEDNKVDLEIKLKPSLQNFTSTQLKEESIYKDNTSDTLSYYDINSFQKESEEKEIKAVIVPQKSNITPTEIIETNNVVETLLPNHPKIVPEEEKIKTEIAQEISISNYFDHIVESLNEPNEIKTILKKSGVSCILSELDEEQKNIEPTTKSNETLVPNETSISNDSPKVPEENLGNVLLNDCHAVTLQPNKFETAIMADNSTISSFNDVKTSSVVELNEIERTILTESTSSNEVTINLAEEPKYSTMSKTQIINNSSVVLIDKQMEIETTTGNSIIRDIVHDIVEPTEDNIKVTNKENLFKSLILNDTLTEETQTNNTFVTPTNEHIIIKLNTKFETSEATNDLTELNQNPKEMEIKTQNVQLVDTLAMPINKLKEIHINTTSENSFLNNLPTESFGELTDSKIDSINTKLLTNKDPINEQNQGEISTTNQTQILNNSSVLSNNKNNDTKIDLISESPISNAVSIELEKKPILVKDANISETLVVNETTLKLEADQNKIENNITYKNILLNKNPTKSGENLKEIISVFDLIPNDTEKILLNDPMEIDSDVLIEKGVQIVLTEEPNKQETKTNPENVLEDSSTIYVGEPSMVELEMTTDTPMFSYIQTVSTELDETKIKTTPMTQKLDNTSTILRGPKEYGSETPPSIYNIPILLEESNDIKIDTISNKLVLNCLEIVTESTTSLKNDAALLNLERIELNVSKNNEESPLTKEIDTLLVEQKPNDTTIELEDKKSVTNQALFHVPVTDQINKVKTIGKGSVCDFIITKSTEIKKGETQKLPKISVENKSEITNTDNKSLVDEKSEIIEKQILNTTKTPQTEEILEPLPEVGNFNFSEAVELVNPIIVNIKTISDPIDKLNFVKSDQKNDQAPFKWKNIVADELKYMKPDNTYDSLISKTIKARSVKKSDESEEHKISKLEKKKLTVEGAEIEIIDSKQNIESECEHQNIILETSNENKSVNIINTAIEGNLQNTFEANKSSYTETELYGKLSDPTIIVFQKSISSDDNENISVQTNYLSENQRTDKSNTSDSLKNYDKTTQKSLSEVKNDPDVNMYGIQKLEMSMQCTKTSNEDCFEKTFVKLEQTEKISIDKNECNDNTTLPDEKSCMVNESDLNAILCASSLEEALTLLDSKIKIKFKNKTRSSSIINSTMYKQSLQTSTSSNSEKNTNFSEAQEFFKNIEKNYKD